jgi:hypothetical protein
MAARRPAGCAGSDRLLVLRQFGKARAKPGIDVFVEDFRCRLDMGVGIEYAQPFSHHPPSLTGSSPISIHPRGIGENAAPKMLDQAPQIA